MSTTKARIGLALKRGFQDVYDRLGLVVASSLILSLALLAITTIAQLALSRTKNPGILAIFPIAGILLGAPLTAGIFKMAHKVAYRDDPSLSDMLAGFRGLLVPSWGLAIVDTIVGTILIADALFFFGAIGPLKKSVVGFGLGTLFIYLFVMWAMAAVYQYPILASQGATGNKPGVLATIKKSLLLTLGNPGFTIVLFVVTLGFGVLCLLTGLGMLVLYPGAIAIIHTHALKELYVRYGLVDEAVDNR